MQLVRQLSHAKALEVPSYMRFFRVLDVGTQVEPHDGVTCATSFAASLVEPASHDVVPHKRCGTGPREFV